MISRVILSKVLTSKIASIFCDQHNASRVTVRGAEQQLVPFECQVEQCVLTAHGSEALGGLGSMCKKKRLFFKKKKTCGLNCAALFLDVKNAAE